MAPLGEGCVNRDADKEGAAADQRIALHKEKRIAIMAKVSKLGASLVDGRSGNE
ncbi:MAG: hypothetical protein ACRC5V_11515 [Aeromonas sp.]